VLTASFAIIYDNAGSRAVHPAGGRRWEDQTISSETRTYPGFPGKIGRTREESEPHWNVPVRPPAGSPNIVIVFMDDMGWADVGCYGSDIDTPNIDALAGRGVRFTHYTTHPICSPARAALLTGRNAHSVATGWLANNNLPVPVVGEAQPLYLCAKGLDIAPRGDGRMHAGADRVALGRQAVGVPAHRV
jgi:arylsulfatase